MATFILGGVGALVGSSFGGPAGARLGWAIGTTVGSIVDSMNRHPMQTGRLADLRYSGSSYGTIIPRAWGKNKLPGNVIWVANYINNKTLVPTDAHLFTITTTASRSPGATTIPVVAMAFTLPKGTAITFLGSGETVTLNAKANAGDTSLTVKPIVGSIASGDKAAVNGATHLIYTDKSTGGGGGNSGGMGGGGGSTRSYTASYAVAFQTGTLMYSDGTFVNRNPVLKKVWANDKLIYDVNNPTGNKTTIRFYTGSESQNPDTLIKSAEDPGNAGICPAYRGTCYIVIESQVLDNFGSQIPNISAEIWTDAVTIGNVFADLCGTVNLLAADIDIASVTQNLTDGWMIVNRESIQDSINPLVSTFQHDVVEVDGKIKLRPRGDSVVATIDINDLGASAAGTDAGSIDTIIRKRGASRDIPRRVDITFYSTDQFYQQVTQSDMRQTVTSSQTSLGITLPLSCSNNFGKQIAGQTLDVAYRELDNFPFVLPPKYLYLIPSDPINVPCNGSLYRMRLQEMQFEEEGHITCSAVIDDPSVLVQVGGSGTGSSGGVVPDSTPIPSVFIAWSGYELRPEDQVSCGFYVAATSEDSRWSGCEVWYSTDAGVTWVDGGSISTRATFGVTNSVLANGVTALAWDNTNTFTNTINDDGNLLGTVSQDEVLNGENVAVVGNEILGFTTAALSGGTSYTISHLYRGIRSSSMVSHASGERFVIADSSLCRIQLTDVYVGTVVQVKCVSANQTLADVTAVNVTIVARNMSSVETITEGAKSANQVFAGPASGGAAAPAFRALVTADFPNTSVTPGSYTLTNLTVDAKGRITAAANGTLVVPGGSNTYIQYNASGAFAGDSTFTWTTASKLMTITNNSIAATTTPAISLQNNTASTSGVPIQKSPSIEFVGHVWNTNAVDWTTRYRLGTKGQSSNNIDGFLTLETSEDTGTPSWLQASSWDGRGNFYIGTAGNKFHFYSGYQPGSLYLPNSGYIVWRNAADTGWITGFVVDGNNDMTLGPGANSVKANGTFQVKTGDGTTTARFQCSDLNHNYNFGLKVIPTAGFNNWQIHDPSDTTYIFSNPATCRTRFGYNVTTTPTAMMEIGPPKVASDVVCKIYGAASQSGALVEIRDAVAGNLLISIDSSGTLICNRGQRIAYTPVTANYTILLTDRLIAYTAIAAARVVSLPNATTCANQVFTVKDEAGNAATNNLTITPGFTQTIDGAATLVINTNYGKVSFYSNGTQWFTC